MRTILINNNHKRNNNLSFKAYFKDNSAGHLKKLYSEAKNFNKLEESIKSLHENRPNHELEILESRFVRGSEESPRVDWREATRSMWQYKVRNNENGHSTWVSTPSRNEHLTQLSNTLSKFSDDSFWRSKKEEERLLKELITPNKSTINVPRLEKSPTLKSKVLDFIKFWTLALK